jgi:hypothetical protein
MFNNNSNSSGLIQTSSRSNDSNGNSDLGCQDIRGLSERVDKIESKVENIQNTLQVFVSCLQNTHLL